MRRVLTAAALAVTMCLGASSALSSPGAPVRGDGESDERAPYETVSRHDYLTGGVRVTTTTSWFIDAVAWDWGRFGVQLGHLEGTPEIPSGMVISLVGVSLRQPLRIRSSYMIDAYVLGLGPGGSLSDDEDDGGVLAEDDVNFLDVGIRYVRNFASLSVGYRWAFVSCEWSENASAADRSQYSLSVPDGLFVGISIGGHRVKNEVPVWWNAWSTATHSEAPEDYADFASRYPRAPKAAEARMRLEGMEPQVFESAAVDNTPAAYQRYLDLYPGGRHAGEARQQLDVLDSDAYTRAEGAGTQEALRVYLQAFPAGRHARDAKIGALEFKLGAYRTTADSDSTLDSIQPTRMRGAFEGVSIATTDSEFLADEWDGGDPLRGEIGILEMTGAAGTLKVVIGFVEGASGAWGDLVGEVRNGLDFVKASYEAGTPVTYSIAQYAGGADMRERVCVLSFENHLLTSVLWAP